MKRTTRFLQVAAAFSGFAIPALVALAPSPPSTASGAETPPLIQSPPIYASRGTATEVTAVPSGRPDAVTLVVEDPSSGQTLSRAPMKPRRSEAWTGSIPRASVRGVRYRVDARYKSGEVERSDTQRLTYLDRVLAPRMSVLPARGSRLLTVDLGSAASDLGASAGDQAARVLPAAFDVDATARRIDVLDTVNARVVTFGFGGGRIGSTPIATGSATVGDLVRLPDGTRYLLDVSRDELIRWTPAGQEVFEKAGLRDEPVDARLVARNTDLYLRDASQGRSELLARANGAFVNATERVADTTPVANVQVNGSSVLVGDLCVLRCGDRTEAARLDFGRTVFDVAAYGVDGHGVFWGLVDVDEAGTATTRLISIDPARPSDVAVRTIDASVFGDVTRRLVTLDSGGVVVMSGTRSQLVFTRYSTR